VEKYNIVQRSLKRYFFCVNEVIDAWFFCQDRENSLREFCYGYFIGQTDTLLIQVLSTGKLSSHIEGLLEIKKIIINFLINLKMQDFLSKTA